MRRWIPALATTLLIANLTVIAVGLQVTTVTVTGTKVQTVDTKGDSSKDKPATIGDPQVASRSQSPTETSSRSW